MTDFTNYLRCIAEIEASDRTYRDSPFFRPLSFTMLLPPCGCNIHGDGNIPSPFHIKFCAEHVAVQDTTAEIKRLRERIVELRGSLAQLDGSARAPNITGEPVVREGKGAVWLYSWIASEEDSSAFAYLSWAELAARNPDLRPCGIGVDELGPYVRMRSVGAWPEARIIQEPLGSPSESEKRVRTAKTAIGTRGVLRRTFFSLCQSPPIAG